METLSLTKKYSVYPRYKDSGASWLGKIPASWDAKKIIAVFDFPNEKVTEKTHQPLSVTYGGIKPQIDDAAKVAEGSLRKLVKKGDIAINARSDRKGAVGMSELEGGVSLVYTVLRKRKKDVDGKYFHYLFRSTIFSEEFYRWGRGIVDDLWTTRSNEMKRITVTVPLFEEQKKIAQFLDEKTAAIDAIIEKKQRQIELLREKRAALIHHVVTKGLDTKVKLVESGVEWIEKIPEKWQKRKFKHIFSLGYGKELLPEDRKEGGRFSVYGANGIVGESDKCLYCGPSIIIGRKGSVGELQFTDLPFWPLDVTYYVRINEGNDLKWVYYLLLASNIKDYGMGIKPGLNRSDVYNIDIPYIGPELQKDIATFLEKKSLDIDMAISKIEKTMVLLQEFKSSLISHAVTGKIRV